MQTTHLACPHCGSALNFNKEIAAGTAVECLICMRTFAANPVAAPAPKASIVAGAAPRPVASAGKSVPKGPPAQPQATAASPAGKPARGVNEPAPAGQGGMWAIALVLLLLVGGGIGVAVWKIFDSKKGGDSGDPANQVVVSPNKKDDPEKKPNDDAGGKKIDPEKKDDPPKKIDKKIDDNPEEKLPPKKAKDEEKKVLVRKDPPKTEDKDPETVPITKGPAKTYPGVNQSKLDSAADKGVAFIKEKQQADGSWGIGGGYPIGFSSFCGLALLECKVPASDPAIVRASNYVRAKAGSASKNYDAAAALLFLDRLGEARDRPLIQALALRLLAGQQADGGWEYSCPSLSKEETQELLAFLQSHKQPNATPTIRAETLSPRLRAMPVVLNQGKKKGEHTIASGSSDNSNTQFALLALWAARRHEVPTDQAILFAHDRFASSQNRDGGWSYRTASEPGGGESRSPITCIGLMGLAMGHGVSPDVVGKLPDDPSKPRIKPALQDPKIKKGMEALARDIGKVNPGPAVNPPPLENLYFLWSLERVGVLYDVKDIGGKEWYAWGTQTLLGSQSSDGSFSSLQILGHDPITNTCFALLFLNRSNLVQDLTVNLRLNSGIRDPEK